MVPKGSLIKIHKATIPVVILLSLWEATFIHEIISEWKKNAKFTVENRVCKIHFAFSCETLKVMLAG